MRILAVPLVTMALYGCAFIDAVSPLPPPPNVQMAAGQTYIGQPVQQMLGRYGAPLRSMPVGDVMVYSWEQSRVMYFDTSPPLPVHCQMDAYVTKGGVVDNIGISGKMGACEMFMP